MKRQKKIPKENDKSEWEKLRGENRQLRKEISQLRRQLEKYNREVISVEEQKEEFITNESRAKVICPECHKGELEFIDLGSRVLESCDSCKYRRTKPK